VFSNCVHSVYITNKLIVGHHIGDIRTIHKMNNSSIVLLSTESSDMVLDPGTIIFAIGIELITLPGLFAYLMVVLVIIRNRKTFASTPYYTLLLSLAFSDIVQTIFAMFYFAPCVLYQGFVFGFYFDWIIGVVGYLMCYYAGLATMVIIALNRYFAVCRFSSHDTVFRTNRTLLYLAGAWAFGFFGSFCQFFPGFGYSYMYGPDLNAPGNIYFFVWFDRFVSASVVTVLAVCYVAIVFKRTSQTTEIGRNALNRQSRIRREKAERSLALQFGIIVLLLLLYECSVQVMYIDYSYLFYVLLNLLYVVFISWNPFVYVAFNTEIRKNFLQIFCCKAHINAVNAHNRSTITRRER
jgi:hypothetical protein